MLDVSVDGTALAGARERSERGHAPASGPEKAPLGLKREVSHPEAGKPRVCGPEGVYLRSSDGITMPMPCGRSDCPSCGKRRDWLSAEMLMLDAVENEAPAVWLCLGTREVERDPARFYRARELVVRALRRRWPRCEYLGRVEFTTGLGRNAGGIRRPHWHFLLKGIPRNAACEAFELAARVWCEHVDAEPEAQRGGEVTAAVGLIRYLMPHHGKESQAPPRGWKGHREVRSRGYYANPVNELREQARESIYRRRAAYRVRRAGLVGVEAELEIAWQVLQRRERTWAYYTGDPSEAGYFLYERDRVEAKLGGWRALPEYRVWRSPPVTPAAAFEQLRFERMTAAP